jgi:hypothetical protein
MSSVVHKRMISYLRRCRFGSIVFISCLLGASLSQAQTAYFGNQAVIAGTSTSGGWYGASTYLLAYFPLVNGSDEAGFRFTAQTTGSISEAQLNFPSVTGNPAYLIGLEDDATGLPSGALLAPGTSFAPVTGWNDIVFTNPVNVTAGNVYHLVVEWDPSSAALGDSNAATLELGSHPDYLLYPQNGAPDLQLAVDENTGGGWVDLPQEPVFMVNVSGTWSGNPYSTVGAVTMPSGIISYGSYSELFTLSNSITIDSVGTYAADSLYGQTGSGPITFNWTLMGGAALGLSQRESWRSPAN